MKKRNTVEIPKCCTLDLREKLDLLGVDRDRYRIYQGGTEGLVESEHYEIRLAVKAYFYGYQKARSESKNS